MYDDTINSESATYITLHIKTRAFLIEILKLSLQNFYKILMKYLDLKPPEGSKILTVNTSVIYTFREV